MLREGKGTGAGVLVMMTGGGVVVLFAYGTGVHDEVRVMGGGVQHSMVQGQSWKVSQCSKERRRWKHGQCRTSVTDRSEVSD